MTAKSAFAGTATPDPRMEEDGGFARYQCALQTTCQPPSSWAKDPWPATICGISTDGLKLSLRRRFERGSGLAIQLPGEDGVSSTVLAKVVHVASQGDGTYVLGCTFISELSEEEVQMVLHLDQLQQSSDSAAEAADPADTVVPGVLFQTRLPSGHVARWFIRQLDIPGEWPLVKGRLVTLRMGEMPPGTPPLELNVRTCRLLGDCWVVNCRLLALPHPAVLAALGVPS